MIFVYLLATEGYKWGKRVLMRQKDGASVDLADKTLRMEPTIAV
jgi:hypothetical protein